MDIDANKLCPCNSGVKFVHCCGPVLSGNHIATTAESLMRSRYTAYVVRDVDYLSKSWHPSTRPAAIDPADIPDWQGLQVVRSDKGLAGDDEGVVEFKAIFLAQGNFLQLHEVSRFVKEGGQWFYVDGDVRGGAPPSVEAKGTKVGRNDPCPCGSGKKFKKCCGP